MYRKNLILIFFILGMFLALAKSAQAANHYIRDGANGASPDCGATTNNWNDACDSLPQTLARGDVYYIADGNYSSYLFNTPELNSKIITIKKATDDDYGGGANWQSEYGDEVALFSSTSGAVWKFTSGYWFFDGVSGSEKSGYGIKLYNSGTVRYSECVSLAYGFTANYLSFNHIEMHASLYNTGVNDGPFAENGTMNNLTIHGCYIHGGSSYLVHLGNGGTFLNSTIEHCYFSDIGSGNAIQHSAGIIAKGTTANTNFTFRYNVFDGMDEVGGTQYVATGMDDTSSNYYVYGNVFYETTSDQGPSRAIGNTESGTTSNVYIYNNTFYNLQGLSSAFYFSTTSSNIIAYNNLWYGCIKTPAFLGVTTHNYNASNFNLGETNGQILTTNPFFNVAEGNFKLISATIAGKNDLGSPFNIDPLGNTRGADGIWDRGAYEYTDGQTTCLLGDINCDGFVKINDIQLAVNVFLNIETNSLFVQRANIDTNTLGVTISDIQKVVNLFLGIN